MVTAGLETTARVLTCVVCYLTTYPDILAKLRRELQVLTSTIGSKPTWNRLEAVPYLVRFMTLQTELRTLTLTPNLPQTAFINESLRCNSFMTDHFPRVTVDPLPYKDWIIPGGVGNFNNPKLC